MAWISSSGMMCIFLCCVLAWKNEQFDLTNTEEQKHLQKKVCQVLKCSTTSCAKKRLQKSLFLAVLSLMISHLLLTTFLMTNAALPWHVTSSFLSGVLVKTKKSKIPYLPRKQLNRDSVIMEQNDAREKSSPR